MPQVLLNGIKHYYRVDGTGERIFLLFNGAGCTTRTWEELAAGLARLGQVIRWDMRGVGETEMPREPYSFDDLAQDGLALLDYLKISAAIIIAHAFGGRVAQIFTRDNPARVQALVLCGTGGLYAPSPRVQNIAPNPNPDFNSRVENWLAQYFGAQFRQKHPERARRVIAEFTAQLQKAQAGAGGVRRQLLQPTPTESYWGKVPDTIPVLLLYGTEDNYGTEANARDLAQRLKDSRLVFIAGAGHMAIQEEPERMLDEISKFIEEKNL